MPVGILIALGDELLEGAHVAGLGGRLQLGQARPHLTFRGLGFVPAASQ